MKKEKEIKRGNIPTIFVIFGATGDLARRKLFLALFDLFSRDMLPDKWRIVGFARREFSDDAYRAYVKEQSFGAKSDERLDEFLSHITYARGEFADAAGYGALSEAIIAYEDEIKMCANKLLYLAAPPEHYRDIIQNIADSGLSLSCSDETGWTRILIEKPFGKDAQTAQELDQLLALLFKEAQIFRIDHYLGKKTVQDILMFRFSNRIFEPLWDYEDIDHVEIVMHEKNDVSKRGEFYDGVGELRDVGQNHVLQMLTLVAMERPKEFSASAIRAERAKALAALVPVVDLADVVRGQYEGFTQEKGVSPDSSTETYFKLKAYVRTPRWKNVPFLLESGKGLPENKVEIRIYFRHSDECLCGESDPRNHENMLTFRIQPDEGISILFWIRQAGLDHDLAPKLLSFTYNKEDGTERIPDAYEKILYDAIIGDQTLFASTEEVKSAWKFITPIRKLWSDAPLIIYKKGEPPEHTF